MVEQEAKGESRLAESLVVRQHLQECPYDESQKNRIAGVSCQNHKTHCYEHVIGRLKCDLREVYQLCLVLCAIIGRLTMLASNRDKPLLLKAETPLKEPVHLHMCQRSI